VPRELQHAQAGPRREERGAERSGGRGRGRAAAAGPRARSVDDEHRAQLAVGERRAGERDARAGAGDRQQRGVEAERRVGREDRDSGRRRAGRGGGGRGRRVLGPLAGEELLPRVGDAYVAVGGGDKAAEVEVGRVRDAGGGGGGGGGGKGGSQFAGRGVVLRQLPQLLGLGRVLVEEDAVEQSIAQ
jgi:hypothetical protein